MRARDRGRRDVLKIVSAGVLGAATGLRLVPRVAAQATWNKEAFAAKDVEEIVKAYGGDGVTPSQDISWGATPEIAENGAVVPVSVTSRIPDTAAIAIVIDKNPNKLAANFHVLEGTQPAIATRVKIAESSKVHALVRTKAGKYFVATREIKVTLGGCGG